MKLKTRRNVFIAVWFLLGVLVLILAVEVSPIFFLGIVGLGVTVSWGLRSIKCPQCKTPALYREVSGVPIWTISIPKNCLKCKAPLDD
jgi:hypothetical protein